MKRVIHRLIQLTILAAAIGAFVWWSQFSPVRVSQHHVQLGEIVAEVMGTGTLEARVAAAVSPKIAGRIARLHVDQGDRVSAGELLFELDDAEWKQQVSIAQANLESADATIARLQVDKKRAAAVQTQARKNYDRLQSLARQNAISEGELDKASEELAIAGSGISTAEAAITEGQKQRIAMVKTLDYHNARLADSRIVAPFDGLVITRNRELGDVVVPGTSVLKLISTDQLWISAWVDETEMSRLKTDQPARIVLRSEATNPYPGTVARLGKEADRETREFVVDVDVLALPENWAVGQRAEAFIEVDRHNEVVLLPADLIASRDGQAGLFVEVEGAAQWREIEIGLRNRDLVEVISGLEVDEIVVTPTGSKTTLRDGRKVYQP